MDTQPPIDLRPPTLKIAGTEFYPVGRDRLSELRALLVEAAAQWLEARFSTGQAVADPVVWALLQKIAGMLPRVDNPAVCGVDLAPLGNHYVELEALFFSQGYDAKPDELHGWSLLTFDLEKYKGSKLSQLHRLNPQRIITDADELRLARLEARLDSKGSAVPAEASEDGGRSLAGQVASKGS